MKTRFETFTYIISKINQQIRKIKTEEVAEFGIKSSHVECIYYLSKYGELTATELCECCNEDKASISRSILFLVENGFIASDDNGHKKYKTLLSLTEKGKVVGDKIGDKIDAILQKSSSGLSDRERLICYHGLEVISKNLHDICDDY